MRICFFHIKFNNDLLIFDYIKQKDYAICTFCCKSDAEKLLNKEAVIKQLKEQKIDGITIDSMDDIRIDNITVFAKNHPYEELKEGAKKLKNDTDINHGRVSPGRSPRVRTDNSPTSLRSSLFKPTTAEKNANRAIDCFDEKYINIDLKHLITEEEDPEIWRKTIVYDSLEVATNQIASHSSADRKVTSSSYLAEKITSDRVEKNLISASCLQSLSSLVQLCQDKQNSKLLPAKFEVIRSLRRLFDQLNPIYRQWCKIRLEKSRATHLRLIKQYFQDAVSEAMDDNTYNDRPTEFEDMGNKFPGNKELLELTILEAIGIRSGVMLLKLRVLIYPHYKVRFAFPDQDSNAVLRKQLISFKKYLANQDKELITTIQQELETTKKLISKVGKILLFSHRLKRELQLLMQGKITVICGFHSFRAVIAEIFRDEKIKNTRRSSSPQANCAEKAKNSLVAKLNFPAKSKGIKRNISDPNPKTMIDSVVKNTIRIINAQFDDQDVKEYISQLIEQEQDFYLPEKWIIELKNKLTENKKLNKILKNPESSQEYIQNLATTIANIAKDYLQGKINTLIDKENVKARKASLSDGGMNSKINSLNSETELSTPRIIKSAELTPRFTD